MVGQRLAENPHFGLSVAGYLEDSPASDELPPKLLLGPISDLRTVVEALKPQRIIVGMTERRGKPARSTICSSYAFPASTLKRRRPPTKPFSAASA